MENKILIGIIVICGLCLGLGFLRHRMELLVNIVLRMVVGILGIYVVNMILVNQDVMVNVGTNSTTIITIGLLGLPGFLLIYGIELYSIYMA